MGPNEQVLVVEFFLPIGSPRPVFDRTVHYQHVRTVDFVCSV